MSGNNVWRLRLLRKSQLFRVLGLQLVPFTWNRKRQAKHHKFLEERNKTNYNLKKETNVVRKSRPSRVVAVPKNRTRRESLKSLYLHYRTKIFGLLLILV